MADENKKRLEEEIKEKAIEIKSTRVPLLRGGSKFQTGQFDYDQSKQFCKVCSGRAKRTGRVLLDGEYQNIPVCTAIAIPLLEDLYQTQEELKQKLRGLCPHTGEIREDARIMGYMSGPYVECQRPEDKSEE